MFRKFVEKKAVANDAGERDSRTDLPEKKASRDMLLILKGNLK